MGEQKIKIQPQMAIGYEFNFCFIFYKLYSKEEEESENEEEEKKMKIEKRRKKMKMKKILFLLVDLGFKFHHLIVEHMTLTLVQVFEFYDITIEVDKGLYENDGTLAHIKLPNISPEIFK
ncbi:hypothetical protein RhiirA4_483706 [Rhizophagus irregularis]|uniref:Uncharacterized protein n=1 Tax=Rhizophagus irregularis TaxID=588596 RepID=A0A2I1HMX2_9GLOM|nr:hypothetical protein RhiirA4_483706 [Rhizophagus irregularis]